MSVRGAELVIDRGGERRRADPWLAATIVVTVLVMMPVAAVVYLAFFPEENIWPHLVATSLPGYVRRTVLLLAGVGVAVFATGVATAWLVTMCRFPGRRLFEWLLLLPLAVPAYVIAYVYTDLLEYAGPVQGALRAWFGFASARDYWFPEVRSLGGAMMLMGLVLYPYVYLLTRTAFLEQSVHMLEASRTLGRGPWRSFFAVSLPMARPAVSVGVALALMETLNDFGTVDYFAVRTLTAGIYDVWLGMNNVGGAAQIATMMLLFVIVLVTLERFGRRHRRYFEPGGSRLKRLPGYRLRGWKAAAALLVCGLPVIAGFVIPVIVLGRYAYLYFDVSWTPQYRRFAVNSFVLSAAAALGTLLIGLLISYARRLRGGRGLERMSRIASLGYAVPGAVLAIGVIVPFAAIDRGLNTALEAFTGERVGLILSGTVAAILFAYVVRFLAIAIGQLDSSLARVTPSMDMAARSLGYGPGETLVRFHLPLIRGGMLTAALVVFVDCMKELPATLILRPFDFDTLATWVYQFASDELIGRASLGALTIVLVGLMPVIILSRAIRHSRQVEMADDPGADGIRP